MKPEERWAEIARLTGHTAAEVQVMFDPHTPRPQSGLILTALRDAAEGICEQGLATRMLIDLVDRCAKLVGVPPDVDPFPEVVTDAAIQDTFGYHDHQGVSHLPTVEQVAVAKAKRKAERVLAKAQRAAAQTAAPQTADQAQAIESPFSFNFADAEAVIKADAGKGPKVSPEVFSALTEGAKPVLVRAEKGAPLLLTKSALDHVKSFAGKSPAAKSLFQTAKEVFKASKDKSMDNGNAV